MKAFLKIGFVVVAMVLSGSLPAQENAEANNRFLGFYDSELFHWNYGPLSGLTLNFQNMSSPTIFGINAAMKNALLQYEDTAQQYRLYRGKTIAGHILTWVGLAAIIGGPFISVYGGRQDSAVWELGRAVTPWGFVTVLLGTVMQTSGQENIFNAVILYNRHRVNEYK